MSAYEGGQNHLPDIPAERWREMYEEAAAELERLRADLARAEERLQWIAERYDGERLLDFDDVPDPYWGPRLAKEAIDRIDAAIAAQGADHE